METELSASKQEKLKQGRRLMIEAAMDMTRFQAPMRQALLFVLVDGYSQSEAARLSGQKRQNVSRSLRKLKPHLAQVRKYIREVNRSEA